MGEKGSKPIQGESLVTGVLPHQGTLGAGVGHTSALSPVRRKKVGHLSTTLPPPLVKKCCCGRGHAAEP